MLFVRHLSVTYLLFVRHLSFKEVVYMFVFVCFAYISSSLKTFDFKDSWKLTEKLTKDWEFLVTVSPRTLLKK